MKLKIYVSPKDHKILLNKYGQEELDRLMDKYNLQLVVLDPMDENNDK